MLRLQCERELKGKLLQLCEQFLGTAGNKGRIKDLITRSLPTFLAIFQGIAHLNGKPDLPDREKLMNSMQEIISLDGPLFSELYAVKDGRVSLNEHETIKIMERYIEEIRRLALIVDSLEESGTAATS